MLKYAKITNEETKQCSVGLGTNYDFYKSIGMVEMDVEQAWNGQWYVSGFCPKKPESVIKQERIDELKSLLDGADYWGQKYIDGEYTAEEWEQKKAQRMAWRAEIRQLEAELEKTGQNSTSSSV